MKKLIFYTLSLSILSLYGTLFASIGDSLDKVTETIDKAADVAETVGDVTKTVGNAVDAVGNIFSGSAETTSSSSSSGPIFSGKGLSGGAEIVEKELAGSVSKEHDIKALIISWTNFLLPIAVTLAVLAIVWAGFLYITALGDDGNMDKAKNIIIWVVVGLLVIAAAYAIVNFVMTATF